MVEAGSLPRRTLETVRHRIYAREWLIDRLLPHPAALGLPVVTFVVARPFSEAQTALVRLWVEQPGAAVLWASPELLLGVFLSPAPGDAESLAERVLPSDSVVSGISLHVDSTEPLIPVYFDFEGVWTWFAQLPGTIGYPRPLPRSAPPERRLRAGSNGHTRTELLRLLEAATTPGAYALGSRSFLSSRAERARERRYLRSGLVEARSFLDPSAVARWVANFPSRVAFIYGELTGGRTPIGLFRDLVTRAGIAPFLLATDRDRVLLGSLSVGPDQVELAAPPRGESVLEVIEESLRGIVVIREELRNLVAVIQHRYDNPLSALEVPEE